MRPYFILITAILSCLGFLPSCKKDNKDGSLPVIRLSTNSVTGKSERKIQLTVDMTTPDGFKELLISKGINLKTDSSYGTNGVLLVTPVSSGTNTYQYTFTYTLSPDEVDKLVGFNFKLIDSKGRSAEKDLTVNTTASGAQIIFSRKWALISKLWQSANPPSETIEDCDKDNVYKWNRDSTITINYGASACGFDGFNVYDKWTLSEDEKTFTQTYHSLFDPSAITVESYKVTTLSNDKLVMTITLDLSAFGPPYTNHELFVYTYNSVP
jgi:hypothetical protein